MASRATIPLEIKQKIITEVIQSAVKSDEAIEPEAIMHLGEETCEYYHASEDVNINMRDIMNGMANMKIEGDVMNAYLNKTNSRSNMRTLISSSKVSHSFGAMCVLPLQRVLEEVDLNLQYASKTVQDPKNHTEVRRTLPILDLDGWNNLRTSRVVQSVWKGRLNVLGKLSKRLQTRK